MNYLETCYAIANKNDQRFHSCEYRLIQGGVGRSEAQRLGAIFDLDTITEGQVMQILRLKSHRLKSLKRMELRALYKRTNVDGWRPSTIEEILKYIGG